MESGQRYSIIYVPIRLRIHIKDYLLNFQNISTKFSNRILYVLHGQAIISIHAQKYLYILKLFLGFFHVWNSLIYPNLTQLFKAPHRPSRQQPLKTVQGGKGTKSTSCKVRGFLPIKTTFY